MFNGIVTYTDAPDSSISFDSAQGIDFTNNHANHLSSFTALYTIGTC